MRFLSKAVAAVRAFDGRSTAPRWAAIEHAGEPLTGPPCPEHALFMLARDGRRIIVAAGLAEADLTWPWRDLHDRLAASGYTTAVERDFSGIYIIRDHGHEVGRVWRGRHPSAPPLRPPGATAAILAKIPDLGGYGGAGGAGTFGQ